MWRFCGGTYKVFKVVDYFYDEANYQIRKCKDTVLLEGVICSGDTSKAFKQKCDRSCFFFWKTAWLNLVIKLNEKSCKLKQDDRQNSI